MESTEPLFIYASMINGTNTYIHNEPKEIKYFQGGFMGC